MSIKKDISSLNKGRICPVLKFYYVTFLFLPFPPYFSPDLFPFLIYIFSSPSCCCPALSPGCRLTTDEMVANLIIILDQVSITEDTPMPFLCEEDIMSKLKEVSAANITVSETNDDLMQPTYKDQQPLAII